MWIINSLLFFRSGFIVFILIKFILKLHLLLLVIIRLLIVIECTTRTSYYLYIIGLLRQLNYSIRWFCFDILDGIYLSILDFWMNPLQVLIHDSFLHILINEVLASTIILLSLLNSLLLLIFLWLFLLKYFLIIL